MDTDTREVDKRLEEYKYFFDNGLDFMCIANVDGYFEVTNPGFGKALGYSNAELCEQPFLSFVHPEDIQATLLEVDKLKAGALTINFENRYRKKDGTYIWLEWNTAPNPVAKKLYAIARDVTDRKEEEERRNRYSILEAKSKEMEQFVYIASHDLREPLLTIKNYIDILVEDHGDALNQEAKQYTQSISKAARRMEALVSGLLDYSRLSRIKPVEDVDCSEIIEEVRADLFSLISSNDVSFQVAPLPIIRGHALEMKLLFQNLIDNAIKFRRKDVSPEIKISSEKIDGGWQFTVTDNGIGIAEKDKEKIFAIFQRLHKTHEYAGTGIGLAHCKKITEIHNGNIWVESQPGLSSTFSFTILTDDL